MRKRFALLPTAMMLSLATTAHADGDGNWPMYNGDPQGTRTSTNESVLTPSTVGGLGTLWRYDTPAAVTGTPAVVGDLIYVGDLAGNFYALTQTGALKWSATVASRITASAIVVDNKVIFGDLSGTIYGFDRKTGAQLWSVRPNPHPTAAIWGSGVSVRGKVVFGIASNEEQATRIQTIRAAACVVPSSRSIPKMARSSGRLT